MAVNPKLQLIKLGVGALSVVAVVGATGLVYTASQPEGGSNLAEAPGAWQNPGWSAPGMDGGDYDDEDDHDDDDDDDDDEHGRVLFSRPGARQAPSGRTRTRRS